MRRESYVGASVVHLAAYVERARDAICDRVPRYVSVRSVRVRVAEFDANAARQAAGGTQRELTRRSTFMSLVDGISPTF